jgi:hypothetical protein
VRHGMQAGNLHGLILAAGIGLLVAGGPAQADIAAGWFAYEAGDYQTALEEFLPLMRLLRSPCPAAGAASTWQWPQPSRSPKRQLRTP